MPLPGREDSDIDIATEHPEFIDWQWVSRAVLPELIVPFKRDMYRAILDGLLTICRRCERSKAIRRREMDCRARSQ